MTARGKKAHRTLHGVRLAHDATVERGPEWVGEVAGERWHFYQEDKWGNAWRAYTDDHATGAPRNASLGDCVRWVVAHQEEWQGKLAERRKPGAKRSA